MSAQTPADVIAQSLTPTPLDEPVAFQRQMAERVLRALTEAGFVVIPADVDRFDADRVRDIIEGQTDWSLAQLDGTRRAVLPADGERSYSALEEAMDWRCGGCGDHGWVASAVAYRSNTGVFTFTTECGHCGYDPEWTLQGEELGND